MAHIDTHAPGSFCWFELATSDQDAAKTFYQSIFGWAPKDVPMGPAEVYTIFTLEGRDAAACYTLRKDQRDQGVPPHWMIYIAVANVDASAARVALCGGTVIMPPFDVMDAGRMSVIQDPTGAFFCIWQGNKNPGTQIAGVNGTVGWADLSTPDAARAIKFYSDVFGWKVVAGKDMSPAGPNDYAYIVSGETMIGGIPPASMRNPHAPPHWMIYVEVADCAATVAKARALGATVHMDTTAIGGDTGWFAVLADPQGAVFALHTAAK